MTKRKIQRIKINGYALGKIKMITTRMNILLLSWELRYEKNISKVLLYYYNNSLWF